jgi:hypothetical protein
MSYVGWIATLFATISVFAQATPHVAPAPMSRDRAIIFSNAKPVIGLPLDATHRQGLCSSDGLTYFDASDTTGTSRVLELYSVSTSGEVRHLRRTVPLEFTNGFNRDFYPGDATLVTLIEAEKRDDPNSSERPRETQYFLSVSQHDGSGYKLVALDLKFKPLKVGQFGSGEFLVLGWEEANQLPELAVLKEDGTVRRFLDLGERQAGPPKAASAGGETLDSLRGAAFVPFGGAILLTYPGTVKPIRVVGPSGSSPIRLDYPEGYRLHDILVGSNNSTIVARVQEMPEVEAGARPDAAAPPRQRIFEFLTWPGTRVREFTFDKVPVSAVSCAANTSLEAIFDQPVGGEGTPADKPTAVDGATQLVVSTVRR